MRNKQNYTENYVFSQKKIRMSLKKQREISANEFSLTGRINSLKKNEQVDFESSLERDFIYLLEFDKEVRFYYEQPLKIYYGKRYYVPDFFIEYWDGRKEIIEVKYSIDLIENASLYETKFKVAEEFCQKNNLAFKIKTEIDIRNEFLFNIKFLRNIETRFNWTQSEYFNEFELLTDSMQKLKKTTPNKLLEYSSSCEYRRAELIRYLWCMILHNKIKTDLNKKLNMESVIWI